MINSGQSGQRAAGYGATRALEFLIAKSGIRISFISGARDSERGFDMCVECMAPLQLPLQKVTSGVNGGGRIVPPRLLIEGLNQDSSAS